MMDMSSLMVDMPSLTVATPRRQIHSKPAVNGQPIQLIYKKGDDDQLYANEKALDIIKNIKGPIGICAIIGPFRQGKSFIMNRLLEKSKGFELGHEDISCTKGIWMWDKPIDHVNKNGEKMSLLLFDTEGLESDEASHEWDTKIFMLSLLLSSLFMYNTKNTLTKDALKKLSLVTSLTEVIRYKSSGSKQSEIPKTEFPDFIWVVRDYFLKQTTTAQERLQIFLEPEENTGKDARQRNKTREAIENSFRSLDCFYVCRPELEVADGRSTDEVLWDIESIDYGLLSVKFRTQMDELIKTIKEKVARKTVKNVILNGAVYAEYIQKILDCLNSESDIFVDAIVDTTINSIADKVLDKVKSSYCTKMPDKLKPLPMNWSQWETTERSIYAECINELKVELECFGPIYDDFVKKFDEFREKKVNNVVVEGKMVEFRKLNTDAIKADCDKKLKDLWSPIQQNYSYGTYDTVVKFNEAISALERNYRSSTIVCNEQESIWKEFQENKNFEEYKKLIQKKIDDKDALERERKRQQEEYDRKQRELEEQRRRDRENEERQKRELEEKLKRQQDEIDKLKYSSNRSSGYQSYSSPGFALFNVLDGTTRDNESAYTSASLTSTCTSNASSRNTTKSYVSDGGYAALSDGRPDMKDSETKELFGGRAPIYKKDGTLDRRYKSNRIFLGLDSYEEDDD